MLPVKSRSDSYNEREAEERERLRLLRLRAAKDNPPRMPTFRGAVATLPDRRNAEVMISGPADTGKTFGALWHLAQLAQRYPGAHCTILRKVRNDMDSTVLRTWRRVLLLAGIAHSVFGGNKPQWYQFDNGSIIYVAGIDRVGKALSGERDFIYINQAEELSLEDWETLTTRVSGRGSVADYTQLFADCNPGPAHHWIKQRAPLVILESRHEDNPDLFDEAGIMTEEGRRRIGILDNLTGVLKERLRFGRWVSAEGTVYAYDAALHEIPRFVIPANWRRIRVIDFGFRNPFACLWIAVDPEGRMYIYRQIYMTQRTVTRHAEQINQLSRNERISATIADHDAEDRATLAENGIDTIPADKRLKTGIRAVETRLAKAHDGKPRVFVFADSLVELDRDQVERREPTNLQTEFDAYSWPKDASGRPDRKEEPIDAYNHACDALRYAVLFVDQVPRQSQRSGNYLQDERRR